MKNKKTSLIHFGEEKKEMKKDWQETKKKKFPQKAGHCH